MAGKKLNRVLISTLLLALLTVGLFVACGPSKPEPDKVTIQLNWDNTVEWAGFYVAQEKGYYADENL